MAENTIILTHPLSCSDSEGNQMATPYIVSMNGTDCGPLNPGEMMQWSGPVTNDEMIVVLTPHKLDENKV